METDILIVGSGIAGLSTALYIAELHTDLLITVLDKSNGEDSNTKYAQGGMAAVLALEKDSYESHIADTLEAGKNRSDISVVKKVVYGAPGAIRDLERWGVIFDKTQDGKFELGLEGGHGHNRIVHHKDITGGEIHRKLLEKTASYPNIIRLSQSIGVDLVVVGEDRKKTCKGLMVFDGWERRTYTIKSKAVVLATGGSGQLFLDTTNPQVATGDGLAMAIRAGATIRDLQYFQFHPTAIFDKNTGRNLLVSEALRGAGAYIVNHKRQRFLLQHTPKGELATRDVISSLIFEEMEKNGIPHVYLDARHIGKSELLQKFPQVYENCTLSGYDLSEDLVPIVPAAHYQCGGIQVDDKGKTGIKGLYAVGECAATGLHGVNRLASNSLTEAMVFAKEIALDISKTTVTDLKNLLEVTFPNSGEQHSVGQIGWTAPILKELKGIMTEVLIRKIINPHDWDSYGNWISSHRKGISDIIRGGWVSTEVVELNNLLTIGEVLLTTLQKENVKHYKNIHF